MEKLILRYTATQQALESLRIVLDAIKKESIDSNIELAHVFESEEVSRIFRDSSIQRFEYCTDLFWKYLQDYLDIKLEIVPEIKSPKNIVRTCSKIGLLTEQEGSEAIAMIEARNMSSHIYREEIAEIIAQKLPKYYALMHTILEKTQAATKHQ